MRLRWFTGPEKRWASPWTPRDEGLEASTIYYYKQLTFLFSLLHVTITINFFAERDTQQEKVNS
jgi:hypothetical protein